MELYKADRSWRTGELHAVKYSAVDAIKEALYYGNESNQLTTLQNLMATIADKLLDSNTISLTDLIEIEALDRGYSINVEDVVLDED